MREAGIAAIALCVLLTGCSSAHAAAERPTFGDVREAFYEPPAEEVGEEPISSDLSAEESEAPPDTAESTEAWLKTDESALYGDFNEVYAEADYGCEPSYEPSYAPSDGLTPEGGVNYHGGRTETYYSSAVLRHADTDEWSVDEDGFYRTDDGYYVVAASDMERGTVFEGSKGECIVLDTGCAAGVTDYYVDWS